MASKPVRVVNVVPHVKIKKEIKEEEDEDCIACQICCKTFSNEVAIRNHARLEHMDAFATGDQTLWMQPAEDRQRSSQSPSKVAQDRLIKIKTEELISSMEPTSLMTLASEDVSYIIIKADMPKERERKRKSEKVDSQKPEKINAKKDKEKEPQPITGPFECLQPSTLVADGTCHQIFFSCCEYSAHFRDEHTRRRKGLRCQVCEKPLLSTGEEAPAPYSCEVCGMGYQTSRELSEHMATDHVKLKPFECNVCHKRFTQQGGVQQHMRMHTGDRPFPCTFCPKAFTQKSGLDQHLRIHTKVKPYRCVICSKTFCQSVHLKQHMRTHTNVSPFQCGICSKRFKQSSHLNYHLKNHNPQTMTEEQRTEYNKLISMMRTNEIEQKDKVTYMMEKNDMQLVEVEVDPQYQEVESDEIEETEVQEIEEDQFEMVEEDEVQDEVEMIDDEEQILAEQSIQVNQLEGEETYILSDTGNEVWSVKMVES